MMLKKLVPYFSLASKKEDKKELEKKYNEEIEKPVCKFNQIMESLVVKEESKEESKLFGKKQAPGML
jgi:hypothetical protein